MSDGIDLPALAAGGDPAGAAVPPGVADGVLKPLDPRFVAADGLDWWLWTAGFGVFGLVGVFLLWVWWLPLWGFGLALVGWAALTLWLVWLASRWPRWSYEATRYMVYAGGVEIHRGVWWKSVINVPKSRVQHTDVSQGPILQRFGLATLTLHTAGTSEASVSLTGLARETALAIRDFLIQGGTGDAV